MLRYLIPVFIVAWAAMQMSGGSSDRAMSGAAGGEVSYSLSQGDERQVEQLFERIREAYHRHDKAQFETLLTRESRKMFHRDSSFGRYVADIRLNRSQINADSAVLNVYEYRNDGSSMTRDYVLRQENGSWKLDLLATL